MSFSTHSPGRNHGRNQWLMAIIVSLLALGYFAIFDLRYVDTQLRFQTPQWVRVTSATTQVVDTPTTPTEIDFIARDVVILSRHSMIRAGQTVYCTDSSQYGIGTVVALPSERVESLPARPTNEEPAAVAAVVATTSRASDRRAHQPAQASKKGVRGKPNPPSAIELPVAPESHAPSLDIPALPPGEIHVAMFQGSAMPTGPTKKSQCRPILARLRFSKEEWLRTLW
jgi:hypothetical protein